MLLQGIVLINFLKPHTDSPWVTLDSTYVILWVMSPSPIYIKKKFCHFDIYTYVLYVFYYLFTTSNGQELLSFFYIFLLFHFITAIYVLHVSDVGVYVYGFRLKVKTALCRRK